MLAGEERSLDEWGKIRLFEVGPQVPPWRGRLFKCRTEKRIRRAIQMAARLPVPMKDLPGGRKMKKKKVSPLDYK